MWYHQESNRGHKDFQSFALPTELWHQLFFFCECKGNDIFLIAKIFANKSLFFVYFGRFYGRLCVCCDVLSVGSVADAICLVFKQGFFVGKTRLLFKAVRMCLKINGVLACRTTRSGSFPESLLAVFRRAMKNAQTRLPSCLGILSLCSNGVAFIPQR